MNEWASITWIMLHTVTVKIKQQYVINCNNEIIDFIYLVINNLPCSICVRKSKIYLETHIKYILDKESLIKFLYDFHNYVNLTLNKKQYDYTLLNRYYLTNTKDIFSMFNDLTCYKNEVKEFLLKNNDWFDE